MNKDNEASISLKKVAIIIMSIFMLIIGMGVLAVSVKLGGTKIIGFNGHKLAQANVGQEQNEVKESESLESDIDSYVTVSEKVEKEQVAIPYETETKNLYSGTGEKQERVIQKGSEGLKEIIYMIRTIQGAEQEKVQIAETVIEEPVNCVVEIKNKPITVENVTSRSSSSINESNDSGDYSWSGTKLTKSAGIVRASETPSGYKETYYNLNMSGCLRAMGLSSDGYGVRADGVKTYNGYVMVASPNLSKYPKGSYIPTTLGMGYVVDYCPSGSLDIAVTW